MTPVICLNSQAIPKTRKRGATYFSLYKNTGYQDVGYIAQDWPKRLSLDGLTPTARVWDFVTIAFSAIAADQSVSRSTTVDGWTRSIELTVSVFDRTPWAAQRERLESALGFLTGDIWKLDIRGNGVPPPTARRKAPLGGDCVTLLSGGMDSLVGGIDLTRQGRTPIFVSQIVKGDAPTQLLYAQKLKAAGRPHQWSPRISVPSDSERSTRARSIGFLAFASLASTIIAPGGGSPVDIIVPENGFISLNVPLSPGRLGSLSTRTTHPVFLKLIQEIWLSAGIPARIAFPYGFKTKGELMQQCLDQGLLRELAGRSTSCSRFLRHGYKHCGRCIPCLVRRAAFLRAGIPDTTKKYVSRKIKVGGDVSEADDVGAVAAACVRNAKEGSRRFCAGSVAFADSATRDQFEAVVSRGLEELSVLLRQHGVL